MQDMIIANVREEFQIPPFFPDEGLQRYAEEGEIRLKSLNPIADLEKDKTFQMLLKNYIYYAYHHEVDLWEQNYNSVILSWMLTTPTTLNQEE